MAVGCPGVGGCHCHDEKRPCPQSQGAYFCPTMDPGLAVAQVMRQEKPLHGDQEKPIASWAEG